MNTVDHLKSSEVYTSAHAAETSEFSIGNYLKGGLKALAAIGALSITALVVESGALNNAFRPEHSVEQHTPQHLPQMDPGRIVVGSLPR